MQLFNSQESIAQEVHFQEIQKYRIVGKPLPIVSASIAQT